MMRKGQGGIEPELHWSRRQRGNTEPGKATFHTTLFSGSRCSVSGRCILILLCMHDVAAAHELHNTLLQQPTMALA